MLFLILFATLAIGFYSTVTTSQQVADSELRIVQALAAAESGLELVRYNLALVRVDGEATGQTMIDGLYADLQTIMNGSANMAGQTVGKSGTSIVIPSGSGYIPLGNNASFRATIYPSGSSDRDVVVDVTGTYGGGSEIKRTIRMVYAQTNHMSPAFTYGLASRGKITVSKGGITAPSDPTLADIISTWSGIPAISISGGSVGGDVAVTTGKSAVEFVSGSVHGSSDASTILNNYTFILPAPPFPAVDTTPFKQYATTVYDKHSSPYKNLRIPANTNPKFAGNSVIEGIMYIESPNKVEMAGNCTVKGLIVFENKGDASVNSLDLKSGKVQQALPAGAEFDGLRSITGIGILAPTAAVSMGGSSTSTLLGSLIAGKFNYTGSANLNIDKGTLITMSSSADSLILNGGMVSFNGVGSASPPAPPVRGEQSYAPRPDTYLEVPP